MKLFFTTSLCLCFMVLAEASAQTIFNREHRDHIWLFGSASLTNPEASNVLMDFSESSFTTEQEFLGIRFDVTNASICDTQGNLLFYTNGISIAGSNGQFLENGERINPGDYMDDWVSTGARIDQGALILPQPGNHELYHVFYAGNQRIMVDGHSTLRTMRLLHALVDLVGNNGNGSVLDKDFPLIIDTLDGGKITACRHANGRDWWVLVPYEDANDYHRFLLSSDGIIDMGIQDTGEDMKWGLGQAVFSPDGSKYINFSTVSIPEGQYVGIYDFDRCTGLLSNPNIITYNDTAFSAGVAISDNGRFAYISSYRHLYQIDLEANDVVGSFHKIADYDGFWEENEFLRTTFFLAQLTPDGRIFINSPTSTRKLHSIEAPNKRGVASDFRQHSIQLPVWNQLTLPNFPYYGLGPLDGSPCDTLGIDNPPPTAAFEHTQDTSALAVEFFDASHYAYEWVWDFGDGSPSSDAHHPVHTYAQDGTYQVCLTVSNVSGADMHCETLYIGTTPVREVAETGVGLEVWPTPVGDVLHLRLLNLQGLVNVTNVTLFDLHGRTVQQTIWPKAATTLELNTAHLPAGMYFYELRDAGRVLAAGKVVKL